MSCYFRHMKTVFDEAGIEVTPQNKKRIDLVLHDIAGVDYKNCSAAWRQLKQELIEDEGTRRKLVKKLRDALP